MSADRAGLARRRPDADPLRQPATRHVLTPERFAAPAADDRPGFRWWWQAPVPVDELVRELLAVAAVGFGEVEIAFSEGFWADADQRAALGAVLAEARELGVGVAMTLGAAWPLQTPNTTIGTEHAAQELQYGLARPAPGQQVGALPRPWDDPDAERPATLFSVVAARILHEGGTPSIVPSGHPFGNPTKLQAPDVSTIVDEASLVVLTDRVSDGVLDWTADGDGWAVFAFWVRDCVQGVTSFLDARAARAATEYLDAHQLGAENVAALPGVGTELFEDSLELNADSLFWSADLAARFAERHGYDLTPFLPVMFAHGMCRYWVPEVEPPADAETASDLGRRVRRDYHRLVTDLYISDHLLLLQDWSVGHGMRHKAQAAYGQNLEPVRSFRELVRSGGRAEAESLNSGDRVPVRRDHPTWRFALDWQRSVVGGAHQGGATRISTELGAQLGAAFDVTLGDYRQLLDKEWAAGITKPFVHGFAAQPPDAPWPTLSRFWNIVSESWNDTHFPEWPNWRGLTDYWARGTAVLETGVPRTDVAVYRDGFLTTAARGSVAEDATTPARLADLEPLERRGFSAQFVDPIGLSEPDAVGDGLLFADGPAYRALVVDERTLTPGAASAIADAAASGVAVVFVGELPTGDSGWGGRDRSAEVRDAVARALASGRVGRVDAWGEVPDALEALGVRPRVAYAGPALLTQVRDADDRRFVLVYNPQAGPVAVAVSFEGGGALERWDLDSGAIDAVAARSDDGRTLTDLDLPGLGLVILALDPSGVPAEAPAAAARAEWPLDGWSLTVASEEPGGARPIELPGQGPGDWRTVPGLEQVSGVGVYRACVAAPEGADLTRAALRFAGLAGSAVVRVGDREFGPVFTSDATVDLGDALASTRDVEIEVRTGLRNAALAAGVSLTGPWPFDVTDSPHGLLGAPVVLAG